MSTDNKLIVLVTGANQGLGYYTVQQLSATNKYHVLLGSRSLAKAHDAITSLQSDASGNANTSDITPIQIDVTSDSSITAAAQHIEKTYGRLDILSNNAGISRAAASDPSPSLRDQYHQLYDTNLFGPAVVTETFLPLLRKSTLPGGKRIAFTGSSTGSLELATKPPHPGMSAGNFTLYRSTKSALNMIVMAFVDRLDADDEGFVVSVCCPGHCATNLNNHAGLKDPRDGAKVIVKGIEGSREEVHGRFFNEEGSIPW